MPLRPRTPKEKAERPFRHGCVQAGHARISSLRREPLIRARSVRKTRGPAYGRNLAQALERILQAARRRGAEADSVGFDPLFERATRRVNLRLTLGMLPIEILLAAGGAFLIYRPSNRLLMALFLAFPLFMLARVLLRHTIRSLWAPTDVLVRREYERLKQASGGE